MRERKRPRCSAIRSSIIRRSVPLVAMSACRPLRRLDSTQIELSCKKPLCHWTYATNGAEFRGCSKEQKTARDNPILAQSRVIIRRSTSNTHCERNILSFCHISCERLLSQKTFTSTFLEQFMQQLPESSHQPEVIRTQRPDTADYKVKTNTSHILFIYYKCLNVK